MINLYLHLQTVPAIEDLAGGAPLLPHLLHLVRALTTLAGLALQIPANKSVLPPGLPPQVISWARTSYKLIFNFLSLSCVVAFWPFAFCVNCRAVVSETCLSATLLFTAQLVNKNTQKWKSWSMGSSKTKATSPQASASYISLLLFSWLDPLVWAGWKRPLRQQDLPAVSQEVSIFCVGVH